MAIKEYIAPGTRFNRLTFVMDVESINGRSAAEFQCECGTIKVMLLGNVKRGKSRSCGCLVRESTTKHGCSNNGKWSPEYNSWVNMKARCNDPKRPEFGNYGGRGIRVCDRWDSFTEFLADMGKRPKGTTLDRINNEGDYEPGNCRWATKREQNLNKRTCVLIEHNGQIKNVSVWAEELGLDLTTVRKRMRGGETDSSKILSTTRRNYHAARGQ